MRLISLELENFRQHAETRIDFTDGITAIIGTNGSGKSTILEAISWAIYGTEATRGTKDSIKWNKAPGRSKVRAELVLSIDNETFRVKRELNKAEVYLEPNQSPLAVSQDEVTRYLTEKLGMNRVEFFNTYFTGQKELDFLGNQKAAERKKFISKVLNYEKIREAQEKVRTDKNSLSNEIIGVKQGLGDSEKLQEEKNDQQEKLKLAEKSLSEKKSNLDKQRMELGTFTPHWTKLKSQREDYTKYSTELKFTIDKFNHLKLNIDNLTQENSNLEKKSKRLEEIEKHLDEYKKVESQISTQEKLQKFEVEKQKTLTKLENFDNEILQHEKKLTEISTSTESKKEIPIKIETLKKEIENLKELIQEETRNWTSKKQEVKTTKKQKETELNKVATQYSIIEQKGENGSCPTCERALKDEFEKVTSHFKEIIAELSQEISALLAEEDKLSAEPFTIKENKLKLEAKELEANKLSKLQGQYEQEIKLYDSLKKELDSKKENKIQLAETLKQIPQGFNRELLEKLKEEFSALKKIYDEILGLKAQLTNKDKIRQNLEQNINTQKETEIKKIELEQTLKEINYSEENYKKFEIQILTTEKLVQQAEKDFLQVENEVKQAQLLLSKIIETENAYKEKIELISQKQEELNHLMELDRFYGQFLEKLNSLARPELSEYASKFLDELTEGRYSVLELNDKYEICIKEDNEAEVKTVISGGEEDIANLCVRLAISQMIAQRSGKTLSLLILDEVFGSLDENRRNNVVSLLHGLTNNFEQVIIITHIDDLKENVDNSIKVEYDEEKGCSIVSQTENSALIEINTEELSLA